MRIHVLGASGAGTTTLGRALAQSLAIAFFDTDDFYWIPTDPPYVEKRPVPERVASLRTHLMLHERWVLSGSLVSWSAQIELLFTHIVFVSLSDDIRLERLAARERYRYGARIQPGGDMHAQSQDFLAYAALYESGRMDVRSRALHEYWLQRCDCPSPAPGFRRMRGIACGPNHALAGQPSLCRRVRVSARPQMGTV